VLAIVTADSTGTTVTLFDAATLTELDEAADYDTYSSPKILDQAGIVELLADHHWQVDGSWRYARDYGTYCTVYQRC
jgi:hypothetical protein